MGKGKYVEGEIYEFRYLKKIMVDEEYLAFEDKYQDRYLIPAEYYAHYNFVPDQKVKCLVVRIDCSGKLSFEPEHPYYKLGEIYDFKFVKINKTTDREYNPNTGQSEETKEYEMVVADCYGNEHMVEALGWQRHKFLQTGTVKCRLIKIVKGNFHLVNMANNKPILRRLWNTLSGSE
jgi:hypothetical protein